MNMTNATFLSLCYCCKYFFLGLVIFGLCEISVDSVHSHCDLLIKTICRYALIGLARDGNNDCRRTSK